MFQKLEGVEQVIPGYAGGKRENPSYAQVTTGATGHAEVVKVTFDANKISFTDLLLVFFAVHDASLLNRQDYDVGTEYRSLIYYTTTDQQKTIEEVIATFRESGKKIVTEVKPLAAFYPAELYHHSYYKLNSEQPYCQLIIVPKLEKLQAQFAHLLKS